MSFAKSIALLIALAFILLAVYSFFPPQAKAMDRASATNAALKDAREAYPNAALNAVFVEGSEAAGWKVKVKITLNANSPCPKVYVRDYELLPIRFREQEILARCDELRTPIIYEEEALVDSLLLSQCARNAAQKGASGFSYAVSEEQAHLIKECEECIIIPAKALPLVAGLNENIWLANQRVWVVEWRGSNFLEVVLLDEGARLLNESCLRQEG